MRSFQHFQILKFTIILFSFQLNLNSNQAQGRVLPKSNKSQIFYQTLGDLFEYYSKWKSKVSQPKDTVLPYGNSNTRQGQVVPILTPMTDLLPDLGADAYLPDLGFIADFGGLVTRDFPASPLVRLSRDLFESEQCAQFVSCETSKFSRRYGPLNWIHNFLQDFPFKGDLADRLKLGSEDSIRLDTCGFNCNPLATLTRGLRMLSLLHEIVRVA